MVRNGAQILGFAGASCMMLAGYRQSTAVLVVGAVMTLWSARPSVSSRLSFWSARTDESAVCF